MTSVIGQPTVTASVAGTEVGRTQLVGFVDSVCIANIYAEGTSNPMPADCK